MSKKKLIIILAIFFAFAAAVAYDLVREENVPPQLPPTVSWPEAIQILNSGDVTQVFQAHSLEVTLILTNGETITTIEPQIDLIWKELERCGATCENIIRATE